MDGIIMISKNEWNSIDKPYECRHEADYSDILVKIGNLYCCCETRMASYNIICFSTVCDIANVRNMLRFVLYLHDELGIDYIRVESTPGRYHLFKNIFGMSMLLQVSSTGRDIYWCHIDEQARAKLLDLSSDRMYYGIMEDEA